MNLYHYTDLNAVHSILDTHKIRMTDIRFLNDKTEYLQGLEILEEASHDVFVDNSTYDKEFTSVVERWLKQTFEELLQLQSANEMFYVASFSRSSDTLSQWRSYGMFAIEFDYIKLQERIFDLTVENFGKNNLFFNLELIDCHYVLNRNDSIEEALKTIRVKVLPLIHFLWQQTTSFEGGMHGYKYLKKVISMLATTFKHPSFIEEQEVRLVISDKIVSDKINFRSKNNILIPYHEFDVTAEVISGLKIGPVENKQLTEQSLDIFNSHRATKLGDERHILTIETSDIPYRTL